jgi:hypothetical protein
MDDFVAKWGWNYIIYAGLRRSVGFRIAVKHPGGSC